MKTKTRFCILFAFALLFGVFATPTPNLAQTPAPGSVLARSIFKGGTDAWKGETDAAIKAEVAKLLGQVSPPRKKSKEEDVKPTRDASSPNGGFITLVALGGDGHTLYFSAPNKYTGNRANAYGGSLMVQLRQNATSQFSNAPFVILTSKRTFLYYYLDRQPGNRWETIEVPLKEGAGWVNPAKGERAPATKADFDGVLASLSSLMVKAEYSFGEDRADIAEVQLKKPAP